MSSVGTIYASTQLDIKPFQDALNKMSGLSLNASNNVSENFKKVGNSINYSTQNINGLSNRLEKLQSAFGKSQIGTDGFNKLKEAIEQTKLKIEEANKSFVKTPSIVSQMTENLKGFFSIIAVGGAALSSINVGINFQKQMSAVGAATNATSKDFDLLKNQARELGATTSFSATQAAEAMTELGKAGLSTSQILTATNDVLALASAGELSLAEASTIGADTMAQFGLQASDMSMIANTLSGSANASTISVKDLAESFKYVGGFASSLGISLTDTSTAISILGSAGIKGSSAGTSLSAVLRGLAAPGTEALGIFRKLGVEVKDSQGNMLPMEVTLAKLQNSLSKYGTSAKASLVGKIFGNDASNLSAAFALMDASVKKGEGSFEDFKKKIKSADAKAFGDKLNDNMNGAIQSLKSALEEIQLIFFDIAEPIFTPIIKAVTYAIGVIGSSIKFMLTPFVEFFKFIRENIPDVISGFALLGGASVLLKGIVISSFKTMFAFLVANPFIAGIGAVIFVIAGLITKWDVLKDKFTETFQPVIKLYNELKKLVQPIIDFISKIFEVKKAGDSFTDLSKSAQTSVDIIASIINTVATAIGVLINPIVAFFRILTLNIQTIFDIVGNLYDVFMGLKKALTGGGWDDFKAAALRAISSIAEYFRRLKDIIFESLNNTWENFKKIIKGETIVVNTKSETKIESKQEKIKSQKVDLDTSKSQKNIKELNQSVNDFIDDMIRLDSFSDKAIKFNAEIDQDSIGVLEDKLKSMGAEFTKTLSSEINEKGDRRINYDIVMPDTLTEKNKEDLKKILNQIKAKLSGGVEVEIKKNNKEDSKKKNDNEDFGKLASQFKSLRENWKDFNSAIKSGNIASAINQSLSGAQNMIQNLGSAIINVMKASSDLKNVKISNQKQNADFIGAGLAKSLEQDSIRTSQLYDSQLSALDKQKQELLDRERQYQIDLEAMKLEFDSAERGRQDEAYNQAVAQLEIEYQDKLLYLEANTADQEQYQLQANLLEEDFNQTKLTLKQGFDQKFTENSAANAAKLEAEKSEKEKADQEKVKKIEADKLILEDQKAKKLEEIEKKKQETSKNVELFKWVIGRAGFEAQKRVQAAQAQMSMALGILDVIRGAMSFLPFSLPLLAFVPFVASAGMTSIAAINAQQYPPPPIFADGGLIGGNSHAMGGQMINAEGGEFIVNKSDTAKNLPLLDKINSGETLNKMSSSSNITNIYLGGVKVESMQNADANSISNKVAEIQRREIYQAFGGVAG
jgi:TP901 family phage tail tape measure protein